MLPESGGTCLVTAKVWISEHGDSRVKELKTKFNLLGPCIGTSGLPDWAKGGLAFLSEGWSKVKIPDDSNSYYTYFTAQFRIPEGIQEDKIQTILNGGRASLANFVAKLSRTFDADQPALWGASSAVPEKELHTMKLAVFRQVMIGGALALALTITACSSGESDGTATTTSGVDNTETTESTETTNASTVPVAELTPLPEGPGQGVATLASVESETIEGELCAYLEFADGRTAAFSTTNIGIAVSDGAVFISDSNGPVAVEGDSVIVTTTKVFPAEVVAEGSPDCAGQTEIFILAELRATS